MEKLNGKKVYLSGKVFRKKKMILFFENNNHTMLKKLSICEVKA